MLCHTLQVVVHQDTLAESTATGTQRDIFHINVAEMWILFRTRRAIPLQAETLVQQTICEDTVEHSGFSMKSVHSLWAPTTPHVGVLPIPSHICCYRIL